MTGFVILMILVAIALLWAIATYNRLVGLRNRVKNGFAQIDVQLTRRHDLIPNLVESVKGYMAHERETLEAVISARNGAVSGLQQASRNPGDPAAIGQLGLAESALGSALGRLFALVESYPDLKASENMQRFQEELASTENKVAFSRQAFNDAVMTYNTACENFPANIIAGQFNFEPAAFLEIEDPAHRAAPAVSFS